jgi:hypothetical protein
MNARAYASRPTRSDRTVPTMGLSGKRRCGCGAHGTGCPKCREAQVHAGLASLRDQAFSSPARFRPESHPLEDFTRLPLQAWKDSFNGGADEEGAESVDGPTPVGSGSNAQPAPPRPRPTGTKVDTTTSYTQAALQAGYLSGMGIVARMQVLPDSTTWDGNEVVESLQQVSSTCPDTLTRPGACNGHSHFPIGAKLRGRGVRPELPAMSNRFYDIHTSQSEDVSFLHDATRNPKGIDSCESVCRQDYSYDGVVIGSHSIRRQFRKGKVNNHDVTVIDVTKTDLAPAAAGNQQQGNPGSGSGSGSPPSGSGGKP